MIKHDENGIPVVTRKLLSTLEIGGSLLTVEQFSSDRDSIPSPGSQAQMYAGRAGIKITTKTVYVLIPDIRPETIRALIVTRTA